MIVTTVLLRIMPFSYLSRDPYIRIVISLASVEPPTALCRSPGVFSPVPVESRVLEGKRTIFLLATRETVHPAPAGRKDSSGRSTFGSGSSPSMQRDPPGLRQSVPPNLRPPLHAASTPPEGVLTWRGDPLLGSAHQEYKLLLMRSGVGTPKKGVPGRS